MFENKIKKSVLRSMPSKSASRQKMMKKELIEIIYTDTTALKGYKSKSQCLSRQKVPSRKNIDVAKLTKQQQSKGNDSKGKRVVYENIMTEKPVSLKWNKTKTRSVEKQKKQWDNTKIPYSSEQVLMSYSHLLTNFQKLQIKQYKKIYCIGSMAKRKEKIELCEFNFDNEQKQYNYLLHDHIAYRFEILGLVGKGSYGQVFRVFDHKKKEEMALKMIKNRSKFSKQAFVEIQILTYIKEQDLENVSNVIKIKDFVIFRKHVCLVFEMMSENLYELIIRNNYNGLSLDLIRRFSIQILASLQFLKKHRIIHCDLKPENILLKQYHKSGIKVIDFGSSCFEHETMYTYIQSRYYRAPQITLGIAYNCKIDMWSAGCIIGELYTGVPLFPGENENQQMKYFVNTLGLPGKQILEKGSRSQLFFENEKLKSEVEKLETIDYFSKNLNERIPDDQFREFLQLFLKWDPAERASPLEAMKSKWIRDGMPAHLRDTDIFFKEEERHSESKTMRISSKSKSKQKKIKLSLGNINSKKINLLQRP